MAQGKRQTPARRKPSSRQSAASKRSAASAENRLVQRLREPRIAAAIGLVLAAAIIAVLLLGGDDDESSETNGGRGPEAVSVEDLQELPESVGHDVYWAGERPDTQYELTVEEGGNIFIRYLEPDTEIGARDVAAFTVGTYPVPDAYGAVQDSAKQPGALKAKTPDGAFVLTNRDNPQSVYIAYPGSDLQIEVYDPDGAAALQAATSGQIEPIE